MIEITETGVTQPKCPNCARHMDCRYNRRTKHYRHSEEFKDIRWHCSPCRIILDLKYQSRIFQMDYNGRDEVHAYEL
jgi:hypothetical protein